MGPIQQINDRQISWLTANLIFTGALISLPSAIVNGSGTNAIFSQIGPLLFAILVCLFLYSMSKQFPDKNIFEIIFIVAGRWGGALINGVLLLFMWVRLSADLHEITGFVNTTLLTRTPPSILALLFVFVLMYFGRTSVEVIARVNDLFFPLLVIGMLLTYLAVFNEYNLLRIEPFLSQGIPPVWKGNLVGLGTYGEIFIMGAFLHTVPKNKLFLSGIRHGVLLGALGYTLLIFLVIAALGSIITGRMMYPTYMVVYQIHITDFLDRLEIVFFSIWFPALAIKVVIVFLACLMALASFTNKHDYQLYSLPLAWFTFAASAFSFQSSLEVLDYKAYVLPVIVPSIQLPLMLIVFLLSKRKKFQSGGHKDKLKIPPRIKKWGRMVYALLVVAVVLIGLGLIWGGEKGIIGELIAIFYVFSLIAATWVSRVEIKKIKAFILDQQLKKEG